MLMTFQERLMIIAAVATVLALPAHSRRTLEPANVRSGQVRSIVLCLLVVAGALLVVGLASRTLLRHVIQMAPLVLALFLACLRPAWAVSAAAPLFAFWFLIMGAIWLFLLGMARIVTGTYTPAEITLSIIIGFAALIGLIAAYRRGSPGPLVAQLGTTVAFAVLQWTALWLSTQSFATR
jgi:hypothetical protein